MSRAMLLILLAAPALAAAGSGFLHLDPMDRYINEASGASSGSSQDDDPFATPAAEHTSTPKADDSSKSSSSGNSIEDAFKAMDDDLTDKKASSSADSTPAAPSHEFDAMDRVARDAGSSSSMPSSMSSSFGADAPAASQQDQSAAPAQQDTNNFQQEQQQQQTEVASEPMPTGQVFDVTLNSELQTALLQKGAHAKQTGGKKNAPDVEAAVAKEKAFDVYIHDGFGEMEKKDIKQEQAVKANKDLKA